jgi:hypothetical protein
MGISHEILTDAALNVVGYLIAGVLLTLLYSSLTNRSTKKTAATAASLVQGAGETPVQNGTRRVEFVDLRSVPTEDSRQVSPIRSAAESQNRQRNRAEVMRLAREMLQSGTPRDNVRSLLPISEGEMALLEKQRA